MSLPHVLLGLLASQPRTGYDLARAIRDEVEPVWKAEISQIYPALARLRREGHVVLRVLGPRRGPHRNLYRVSAAGRRELRRWLLEPPPAPRSRDDGLARVAFLESLTPPERRAVLRSYERVVAEEIARLAAAPLPAGFRREAREGAVEKLEGARRWARSLAQRPSISAAAGVVLRPERPVGGKKK
ncbi:MAG TPA: PadR family transcriptional regulator [Thermoanaerobaculia bacterium]